jgi:hypothetical protein
MFIATIGCGAAPRHAATPTTTTLAAPARTICTASAFLAAAQHSFPPGIAVTTVATVRCGGPYMEGSITCRFVERPHDGCQPVAMMFHYVDAGWKLVTLGAWNCATDPDPAIRAGCSALADTT